MPVSSPCSGASVTPPGNYDDGGVAQSGDGHHHGGQALVAGGDAHDAARGGKRARLPSEYLGGVVAIGQGIEHTCGALGSAVARVGAEEGEGDRALLAQFEGRGLNHGRKLEVAGVESERDRRAVGVAKAAGRGEYDELLSEKLDRVPAHAGVLSHAEVVAAGAVDQEVLGEGERSTWPGRVCENPGVAAAQDVLGGEFAGIVFGADAGGGHWSLRVFAQLDVPASIFAAWIGVKPPCTLTL